MPIASILSPSSALARTFARPPSSSAGSLLQGALRTSFTASPPATSSFFTRAPALLPNASSVVAGWSPATPATIAPMPVAPAASSSVGGVFAQIARLSRPSLPASALQFARTAAPVNGFTATPVSAGWRSVGNATGAPRPVTPFVGTPPAPTPTPAADWRPAATLPPALPPVTPAATTAPQSTPVSTLPDTGYYPQGGFDPGSTAPTDPYGPPQAPPTPAASSPGFGTIALYGGGALAALFLLSKMFKGGGEASA